MKRNNLKTIIPLLAIGTSLAVSAAIIVPNLLKEDEVVLKNQYFMNETVKIPQRIIDCDGTLKASTCEVKTPSGDTFKVEDSFVISEFGRYELTFSATHNEKVYKEVEPILSVRQVTDLFTLGEGNLADAGLVQDYYRYDNSYFGLKATISAGASLYFNQIIDFNDLDMETPLLSMLIEPHCDNGADCSLIEFLFTDIDDPTNTLTILYAAGDNYGYVRSGGKGQITKGWQNNWVNKTSNLHVDKFGNPMNCSFDRTICETKKSNYPLKLFYEVNTNQLYGSNTRVYPFGETPSFVIDYDDRASWGDNIWKGFTNGKATLKITPKQTSSPTSTLLFQNIYNYNLMNTTFVDEDKPILTLDKLAMGNVAPQAKLGEPYTLFSAKSFDGFDGELNVDVAVKYVNPTNQARSDVEIIDNTFTPLIPGVYEIVYSSVDKSGNSESKTVSLVASSEVSPLQVNVQDFSQEVEIFSDVEILPLSAASVTGGSGEPRMFRTIYGPNNRVINTDEDTIFLEDVGEYKIVYEAIDYLGHHGSKTIIIKSNKREKPKIMGTFSFPEALLKGFTYDIPTLYTKECTDNGVVNSTAVVLIDGQVWNKPTFTATGESVTIKYVARGVTGKQDSITKTYEIRDGQGGKKQDEYFLCEYSGVTVDRNYIEYNTSADNNKTSFINKINSRSFTLIFNYDFETFNASGVKITLEDQSRTRSFTLNVSIGRAESKLNYPGCTVQPNVATQYSNGVSKMRFSYNSAKNTVTDISSNVLCSITKDDAGKAFTGFEGYLYMSISIINPDPIKSSSIMLEKLSNQTLGYRAASIDRAKDNIAPEIYVDYEFDRKQIIGSTFIVPKAYSSDVLNPIKKFTLDVYSRNPDYTIKNRVMSGEDASVEHSFKLTTYDEFIIKYTAVDGANNEVIETKLLNVVENQPPVLEADYSSIKKVYQLGSTVGLPSYRVSDNSNEYEVAIYLIDPHSRMYLLQLDNSGQIKSMLDSDIGVYDSDFFVDKTTFKLLVEGKYTFKIVATDACYNYSFSEYSFYAIGNN